MFYDANELSHGRGPIKWAQRAILSRPDLTGSLHVGQGGVGRGGGDLKGLHIMPTDYSSRLPLWKSPRRMTSRAPPQLSVHLARIMDAEHFARSGRASSDRLGYRPAKDFYLLGSRG